VNFDGAGSDSVREFVLANARMWLEEFHFDGLRIDAVHSIFDFSARHILVSLTELARGVARRSGREVHVIAESDLNDPRVISPSDRCGYGVDGQWADDFHHAVHAFFTGERRGYYEDFGQPEQLARAFECPFIYAGQYSRHRDRVHGAALSLEFAGKHFVVCLQNHDQIGNRARGERLSVLLDCPAQQRLAASLLLFAPYTPLIFMGQEYGEISPFPFFCSFDDSALVDAVRTGRAEEFREFHDEGGCACPARRCAKWRSRKPHFFMSWPSTSVPTSSRFRKQSRATACIPFGSAVVVGC
jgi:maltooligosyltrehalose trehalohydrolase